MGAAAVSGPLNIRRDCSWRCSVNLLDRARELDVFGSYERTEMLVSRIERLRYVAEVEDRHQFWCVIDPETADVRVATRRVEQVLIKIDRLLVRYKDAGT